MQAEDEAADPRRATPAMIAAAWRAFRLARPHVRLGPGPAFVEAVNAALAADDRDAASAAPLPPTRDASAPAVDPAVPPEAYSAAVV